MRGNVVLAGAQLLVKLECFHWSKVPKTPLAKECVSIMSCYVFKQSTKVFDPRKVMFEV